MELALHLPFHTIPLICQPCSTPTTKVIPCLSLCFLFLFSSLRLLVVHLAAIRILTDACLLEIAFMSLCLSDPVTAEQCCIRLLDRPASQALSDDTRFVSVKVFLQYVSFIHSIVACVGHSH